MEIIGDFMDFLKEYRIVGLAVAFIIGAAATSLVKALVNDIIMPAVTPFIASGGWKTATVSLGPVVLSWGDFLGELLNFVIIAFAMFIIVKTIEKGKRVTKVPPRKINKK